MKLLLRRFQEWHSNERGSTLIESVAWTAAIAVMLWAIYAVLVNGAPQMVGAWTNAGINQRDLWEGRGNLPGGFGSQVTANPNSNGGQNASKTGSAESSNLWTWLKGRAQDLAQFLLKDLPDALKEAARNTSLLITRLTETLTVDLGELGQWLASRTTTIIQAIESPKTWQEVLNGFGKDLGRAAGWAAGLTVAIDVLDKLLRGQGNQLLTGSFGLHLLVDTAQGLLVGAAAAGLTAAAIAALPLELGAVATAGVTLGIAAILGSVLDLTGAGDKLESWIKGWFGGSAQPAPEPAS